MLSLNLDIASHTATRWAWSLTLARRARRMANRARTAPAAWILHTPTSILLTRRVAIVATAAASSRVAVIAGVLCIRQTLAYLTLSNGVVHNFFIGKAKVKKAAEEQKDSEKLGLGKGHFCCSSLCFLGQAMNGL